MKELTASRQDLQLRHKTNNIRWRIAVSVDPRHNCVVKKYYVLDTFNFT